MKQSKWKKFIVFILTFSMLMSMMGFNAAAIDQSQNADAMGSMEKTDSSSGMQKAPQNARERLGESLDGDYAYISNLSIKDRVTGTAPFDEDDQPGNDPGADNDILRTFDTAAYNITFETHCRSNSPYTMYKNGELYFEFIVPGSTGEVQFEDGAMGWLTTRHATYHISEEEIDGAAAQVLRGHFTITPNEGNEQGVGETEMELNIFFRAMAMHNGDIVTPKFTLFLGHNDVGVDIAAWGTDSYTGDAVTGKNASCPEHGESEAQTVAAVPVTITAAAASRYNVELTTGTVSDNSYIGEFDFATGDTDAINHDAGVKNGRVSGYGIALSLVGKSADQGLRGIELPDQPIDISFDLELSSVYNLNTATEEHPDKKITIEAGSDFAQLVWSGSENRFNTNSTLSNGRTLKSSIKYAMYVPLASGAKANDNSCANSGTWKFVQEGNTIHVTVSGAVFDKTNIPYRPAYSTELYYKYYNPNQQTNYWDIQTANFAAGQLWLLQPFLDRNGKDISEISGSGAGQFNIELKDTNLVVNGTSIANGKQAVTSDDRITAGIPSERTGSVSTQSVYHKYLADAANAPLTEGCRSNGRDWVLKGGQLSPWIYTYGAGQEGANRIVAIDSLIKFDNDFFDPDGKVKRNGTIETFLWGAKKDKTGWDHKGLSPGEEGYDEEMINATPDDLVFFNSLSELEAAGYTCVAALGERRILQSENHDSVCAFALGGTCKDTAQPGQVYMITSYSRVWNLKNLAAVSGKTTDELINMSADDRNALIRQYIPSRKEGKSYSEYEAESFYQSHPVSYKKPFYNENGYNAGTESPYYGDSCYVVPLQTGVSIEPAQKYTSGTSIGETKEVYDMDLSQRVADFVVTPNIYRGKTDSTTEGASYNTDLTVTVTLPAGLNYLPGSSYVAGEYSSNGEGRQGSVDTGSIPGSNPSETGDMIKYTDAEGNEIEASVSAVKNSDGTTTLTYHIKGMPYTAEQMEYLSPIHFSAAIGTPGVEDTDVKDGNTMTVTATIQSPDDNVRPVQESNGNLSNTTIRVVKLGSGSIYMLSDQSVVEPGQEMGFTMRVNNAGSKDKDIVMVNKLPYNGDGKSSFTGDLEVTELRVDLNELGGSSLKYYYTTDTGVRNIENENLSADEIAGTWTELTINPDGTLQLPASFKPVAIAAVGTLEPQKNLTIHESVNLPDGKGGERVENSFTEGNLYAFADSQFAQRSIEGLVWLDTNKNGTQGDGENTVDKVTVTLKKLNDGGEYEEAARILTGQQYHDVSKKSEDYTEGHYRFSDLQPGTYRVEFSTGDGLHLPDYIATTVNAGDNTAIDSDGIAISDDDGRLTSTYVDVAEFVPASQMTYATERRMNVDSGFYLAEMDFTAQKAWSDENNKYGLRPDGVTVQLYAGESPVNGQTAVLDENSQWSHTFKSLPKYNPISHEKMAYSVIETKVGDKDADASGYTPDYGEVENDIQVITNRQNHYDVTFTGESGRRTYNGSEHNLTGVTVEGLLEGHSYEGLTYSAKGTDAGEYDGLFSGDVVIKDASGVDVTGLYNVTQTPGHLTIDPSNPVNPPIIDPDDPDDPDDPTPPGPVPDYLNVEDHYGYIVGYPEDYETGEYSQVEERQPVHPERNITRAEVATIFFRLFTDESRETFWSKENDYADVAANDWYNTAVSTLSNAEIIKGDEDGNFRPNDYITRAEFAAIATRFFDFEYEGPDFFSDIEGHWAQDLINRAANAGLISGYPDGTFGPQRNITRAEAVTLVNRILLRYPDKDQLLDDMRKWPDNADTSQWYYADIQEATNSHDYKRDTDQKTEIWTKILPVRDWVALEMEWSAENGD